MKEIIEKIKNYKNTVYIMSGMIAILIIVAITLVMIISNKNIRIDDLNKQIIKVQEDEKSILKKTDAYKEFKNLILVFAKEKYDEAYNYYLPGYFKIDEIIDIGGKSYWKIYRIDEIKELFTERMFKEFTKENKIVNKDGNYYISTDFVQKNNLYNYDKSGTMDLREINDSKIEIIVEEYYFNFEDGLLDENDMTSKMNKFTLVKEDGIWKIDEYTYPNKYKKYYKKY